MDLPPQADLEATLRKISDLGANGLVIWGSSNDMNTKEKCVQFGEYLKNDLGPSVDRARRIALGSSQYNGNSVDNRIDGSVDQA